VLSLTVGMPVVTAQPHMMLRSTTYAALRHSACRNAARQLMCRTMAAAGDAAPDSLTITRPDDWHLHVRDGGALGSVVPHSAAAFGRAIIMPNLQPPVTTVPQVGSLGRRVCLSRALAWFEWYATLVCS
jgi:hypothetical protein